MLKIVALVLILVSGSSLARAAEPVVAYSHRYIPDPQGGQIEIGIFAPTDGGAKSDLVGPYVEEVAQGAPVTGQGLGLIVFSHGNGGVFSGHVDTALALARAGFVVAALTHEGDNYRDQSRAIDLPNRPRQLKALVDYMLGTWEGRDHLDPARVGAFGFSAGGFTVLALAGGEIDLSKVRPHCADHPGYYDCRLIGAHRASAQSLEGSHPVLAHDERIRALVVAAPAMGFAFGPEGLAGVKIPVQLWRAEFDHILPDPDYASAVARDLPHRPEVHLVAGADHFDFLAPCNDRLRQVAAFTCQSRPGFDRTAFHSEFNAAIVQFFTANLPKRP